MARIAGVDLPREKRVEVGLTYIFGVGRSTARKICRDTEVDPDTKVRDLAEGEVGKIRTYIDQNVEVEGDLRRRPELSGHHIGRTGDQAPQGPPVARTAAHHQRPHSQGKKAVHRRRKNSRGRGSAAGASRPARSGT